MKRPKFSSFFIVLSVFLVSGCGTLQSSRPIDASRPFVESSAFSDELYRLGEMSVLYNAPLTKIQSAMVMDDTGAWRPLATGGEIQRDITEIVKSTLNAIGGRVVFIEYDPNYIANQMSTGYSTFKNKLVPDIVLTGGITGFDRALVTDSDTLDASADLQFHDIQSDNNDVTLPPSETVSASYQASTKIGLAKITLDFNMKDFRTLAGIPYMTSTQSMLVKKDLQSSGFAVTLFGPTFGSTGSTKRVQGRHEAVRVIVQSSLIHLIGRYLTLPYWRLVSGVKPDRIVLNRIKTSYRLLSETDRNVKIQTWLILHGYKTNLNGKLDDLTRSALHKYASSAGLTFDAESGKVPYDLYESLYVNIPLNSAALSRRIALTRILAKLSAQAGSQKRSKKK